MSLADKIQVALMKLPIENARYVPEPSLPKLGSVLCSTPEKVNAVLGQYMWRQAAELLILVLENKDELLVALRKSEHR